MAAVAAVVVVFACCSQVAHAQSPGPCGTVLLAGSSWLNGGGVDVKSNGAYEGLGTSCDGGSHFQCVELVNRLYAAKGWISSPVAWQWWTQLSRRARFHV